MSGPVQNTFNAARLRGGSSPRPRLFLLVYLISVACSLPGLADAAEARLIASDEPDWPQFRGPRRDGICTETNLLQSWPEGGPRLLWSASNLGNGYSAPIIVRGLMFLAGDAGDNLLVHALDLNGKQVWTATNGASWKTPYPGARASCTYAKGRVLHLNAHARLACYDAASGRELWAAELKERFGSRKITWATSECVLVDGSRVVVTAGGTKALVAALDLDSGATVWTTPPVPPADEPRDSTESQSPAEGPPDAPSYASPILLQFAGRKMIVGCSQRQVFGVDAETGRLLWTRPLRTSYDVIAMMPVLIGDGVFVTAPDTDQGGLHRIRTEGTRTWVEEVWRTRLDTCHGGVVLVDGALYGSWYRARKGWACIDPATGAVQYELSTMAKGSVLYADKRLYMLSEEGEMALMELAAGEFKTRGKFRLVQGRKSDVWTHPVIHKGRLYLRYHGELWCYDIGTATK